MIVLASFIFGFSCWAVFSKHFCDGLVTKHLLTFAAITSMLVILDPHNRIAMGVSSWLFISGIMYWYYKHQDVIRKRLID